MLRYACVHPVSYDGFPLLLNILESFVSSSFWTTKKSFRRAYNGTTIKNVLLIISYIWKSSPICVGVVALIAFILLLTWARECRLYWACFKSVVLSHRFVKRVGFLTCLNYHILKSGNLRHRRAPRGFVATTIAIFSPLLLVMPFPMKILTGESLRYLTKRRDALAVTLRFPTVSRQATSLLWVTDRSNQQNASLKQSLAGEMFP